MPVISCHFCSWLLQCGITWPCVVVHRKGIHRRSWSTWSKLIEYGRQGQGHVWFCVNLSEHGWMCMKNGYKKRNRWMVNKFETITLFFEHLHNLCNIYTLHETVTLNFVWLHNICNIYTIFVIFILYLKQLHYIYSSYTTFRIFTKYL